MSSITKNFSICYEKDSIVFITPDIDDNFVEEVSNMLKHFHILMNKTVKWYVDTKIKVYLVKVYE